MKKSFKKIIFAVAAVVLLTVSCTEESQVVDDKKAFNFLKSGEELSLKPVKDINDFADNHILITGKISDLIYDSKIILDDDFDAKLQSAKSEDELKTMLKGYGMSDLESNDFVDYLHLMNNNYSDFVTNDPKFTSYSLSAQQSLVEGAINDRYDLLPIVEHPVPGTPTDPNSPQARTCKEQLDIDLYRCARNEAIGLGVSVVSGWFSGGTTAVIGYAASALYYKFCEDDAIDDYHACME